MRRFLRACLISLALLGGSAMVSGCIIVPPRGAQVWVPGHWAHGGNMWVGGHWRYR